MGLKLKVLSYKDLLNILKFFGFQIHTQKGSHIKLLIIFGRDRQILIVPRHNPINSGTLKAIFKQASKYESEETLSPYFFIKK